MAADPTPPALDTARGLVHWVDLALASGDYRDVFDHLDALRVDLDQFERHLMRYLNDTGHTWTEIGTLCGRGRQGAFNRYKRLMK